MHEFFLDRETYEQMEELQQKRSRAYEQLRAMLPKGKFPREEVLYRKLMDQIVKSFAWRAADFTPEEVRDSADTVVEVVTKYGASLSAKQRAKFKASSWGVVATTLGIILIISQARKELQDSGSASAHSRPAGRGCKAVKGKAGSRTSKKRGRRRPGNRD
jgi:hypothetical protein